jgi:hypothetical protein
LARVFGTSFWHEFLARVFGTSFWHEFLARVFGTSFWHELFGFDSEDVAMHRFQLVLLGAACCTLSLTASYASSAEDEIESLIAKLGSADQTIIVEGMTGLQNLADKAGPAVPSLVEHLDAANVRLIVEAGRTLVKIDSDYGADVVRRILSVPGTVSFAQVYWIQFPALNLKWLTNEFENPGLSPQALKAASVIVHARPLQELRDADSAQVDATKVACLAIIGDHEHSYVARMDAARIITRLSPEDAGKTLPLVLEIIRQGAAEKSYAASVLKPAAKEVAPLLIAEFDAQTTGDIAHILAVNYADSFDFVRQASTTSENPSIRLGCAVTLGRPELIANRREASLEPLSQLLLDEEPSVRFAACRAISNGYDSLKGKAAPVIFALLPVATGNESALVSVLQTITDIGQVANDQEIEVLAQHLENDEQEIATWAAVSLVSVWPAEFERTMPVFKIAVEETPFARPIFGVVLEKLTLLGTRAKPVEEAVADRCDGFKPTRIGLRMDSGQLKIKLDLCRVLIAISPEVAEHEDRLMEVAGQQTYGMDDIQGQAIWALVDKGTSRDEVHEALTKIMTNRRLGIHRTQVDAAAAIIVLFPAKQAAAVSALKKSLGLPTDREQALKAALRLGDKAMLVLPEVVNCLNGGFIRDRILAVKVLGQIGPPAKSAISQIETAGKTSYTELQREVKLALEQIRAE